MNLHDNSKPSFCNNPFISETDFFIPNILMKETRIIPLKKKKKKDKDNTIEKQISYRQN